MRLDFRTHGMLGQCCSLLLLGYELEAAGCQPVPTGNKACTVSNREVRQEIRFLANTDKGFGPIKPLCFGSHFESGFRSCYCSLKHFMTTPLTSAFLAPPLNSLPQLLGSLAPNPGKQSSLALQLALHESQNPQSRHRRSDPRKIPTTQQRPLFSRRAGIRSSPLVHFSPSS